MTMVKTGNGGGLLETALEHIVQRLTVGKAVG